MVVLTTTIEYCWGGLEVILGEFGANLSPFGGPIACNWSHFRADFTRFSDPKLSESPKIIYSGTDHKHTVPGGSLWGPLLGNLVHVGPFGAHFRPIWRPHSKSLGHYWDNALQCHHFLQPKRALLPFYQAQWHRLSTYSNRGALNVH